MNHTNHGLHSMSGNNFVPFYSISLFLAFAFLLFKILKQNFGLFHILEISDSQWESNGARHKSQYRSYQLPYIIGQESKVCSWAAYG
jgi:hypothetical protein